MNASWIRIINERSPQVIEFWGTLLVQLLFFWLPSVFYLSLDHVFPNVSQRHKLQPQLRQPTVPELRDCLYVVLRNQLLSALIHVALLSATYLSGGRPVYNFSTILPPYNKILSDVIICILLREILFYYLHRLLHLPAFYPTIHKVHHRFTAPVALAAQYAHPIEHFVANTLPISIPPMILRCHVVTFWMFLAAELLETTTVHSGYDFLNGWARKHDLHHEKFMIFFGTIGVLDWIHGTDSRGRIQKLQ